MNAHRILLCAALSIVFGTVHCSSCRDDFIAELITKKAGVDRDFSRAPTVWSSADTGDRFAMGDGMRTGVQAEATLALPRRARMLVKSETIVRFKRSLDPTAPADQIEVQRGELTIETGALDLGVPTPRGIVKLTPESKVQLRAHEQTTRFDVIVGRAEYTLDGETRSAEAGDHFELEVLPAQVEKERPALPEAATPSGPPSEAPSDATEISAARGGSGKPISELSFQEPPPGAIISLPAGESAVIHDPAPPSDVRITFQGCPELAVLELDRGNGRYDALRARGREDVRARIPRGNFKYRVRCARDGYLQPATVARGRLTVVSDAATRPLPLAPAAITADADGRRYNVSYQNRLPIITLRWPNAPRANAYVLFVRPDQGKPLSVESNKSSVTLESGRVGEGLHRFWFETREKQHSEQGLLQVSFDFTARTAYLTSPAENETRRDGRARFAGGTLLGSKVQAQGAPLQLDAQGRFESSVEVPAGAQGAYVRVEHRSTGIHYYVRHLR